MKNKFYKVLSILLAATLTIGVFSAGGVSAFASEVGEETVGESAEADEDYVGASAEADEDYVDETADAAWDADTVSDIPEADGDAAADAAEAVVGEISDADETVVGEVTEVDEAVVGEVAESSLLMQTLDADVISGGAGITLTGMMPEGAYVTARSADVDIDGVNVIAAYDITIYDADGCEYEPEAGAISVTMDTPAIRDAMSDGDELFVYHMEDELSSAEKVAVVDGGADALEFEAESFSIYIVGTDEDGADTYTNAATGEVATVYTVTFHEYVFDHLDYNIPAFADDQLVPEDGYLAQVSTPEVAEHIFDGWFTEEQDADGTEGGFKYDFDKTVGENLADWGDAYEIGEGNVIDLYSDFDPIHYIYYMTDEGLAARSADYDEATYAPYVFLTEEYHENDSVLDVSAASKNYRNGFLTGVTTDADGNYVSYAVTDWYYIDSSDPDADENGRCLISEKSDEDGNFTVTKNLTLYPVVEEAIWIYFDMNADSAAGPYEEIEPMYVLATQESVSGLPTPKLEGYGFEGWYTAASGDDATEVEDGTAFEELKKLATGNGTVQLYAHWSEDVVEYTLMFWKQKATDGQLGIDQQTVQEGEEYNTYIQYYDYSETIKVDASESGLYAEEVLDKDKTGSISAWDTYTGYGATVKWSERYTNKYFGFNCNLERTLNDLDGTVVAADGSTVINIFYDRDIITWYFNVKGDVTITVKGLYYTNIMPQNGSEPAGDQGQIPYPNDYGQEGVFIWYSFINGSYGYVQWVATPFFTILHNPYHANSDNAFTTLTFTPVSVNIYDSMVCYYLEITDRVQYEDALAAGKLEEAAENSLPFVKYANDKWYVYDGADPIEQTHAFLVSDNYEGYQCGWYAKSAEDDTLTAVSGGESVNMSAGDTLLLLYYDVERYSVTVISGENVVETCEFAYGRDLSDFSLPTDLDPVECGPGYDYYELSGTWYSDPDLTVVAGLPDKMPAKDISFYAEWKLKDITVTFQSAVDSDIGDILESAGYEASKNEDGSYSVTMPATSILSSLLASLTAVDDERYTFAGWLSSHKWFDLSSRLSGDITLTACWSDYYRLLYGYTLSYDLNTGGGTERYSDGVRHVPSNSAGEWLLGAGDVCGLLGVTLDDEHDGRFLYWSTDPTGEANQYYPGQIYDFMLAYMDDEDMDGDVVLYAIWRGTHEAALILDYNYPDGELEVGEEYANETFRTASLAQINLASDTDSGIAYGDGVVIGGAKYVFDGWSLARTDAGVASEDDVDVKADDVVAVSASDEDENTLYAVWVKVDTVSEGGKDETPDPTPTVYDDPTPDDETGETPIDDDVTTIDTGDAGGEEEIVPEGSVTDGGYIATSNPGGTSTVQTGDASPVPLLLMLICICGAAIMLASHNVWKSHSFGGGQAVLADVAVVVEHTPGHVLAKPVGHGKGARLVLGGKLHLGQDKGSHFAPKDV